MAEAAIAYLGAENDAALNSLDLKLKTPSLKASLGVLVLLQSKALFAFGLGVDQNRHYHIGGNSWPIRFGSADILRL